MERRLAAILAADVVGYSRLMETDEAETLAALKSHRENLIDPMISDHHGRIVKLMGDGALVEFASVVDAVNCALGIQDGMGGRNEDLPEDRRIVFRIGVHLGDVMVEGDDLYGDGVNIAARLEGLARPGGVCISQQAYDQVETKLDLAVEDCGSQQVKNIARPVRVFRVMREGEAPGWPVAPQRRGLTLTRHAGLALMVALILVAVFVGWWRPWQADVEPAALDRMAFPLPDEPSIAVLPFSNLTDEPGQDYFVDGFTENVITELSRDKALFVIARNSTFTYKGTPVQVKRVAEELGVRYVLEGSVQRDGDRLRVSAQLIDATQGAHVWAERYDRKVDDLFAVQDEIARRIVASLRGYRSVVQQADLERTFRKPTESLSAYDNLLRGIMHKERFTEEENVVALDYFEKAVALDPDFALGHSWVAWVHILDIYLGWTEDVGHSVELALDAANRSVQLDPGLDMAHWALGAALLIAGENRQALAEFERALELNPNNADIMANIQWPLARLGRHDEGLKMVEQAIRLNPHHPEWYLWNLGIGYYGARRYREAAETLERLTRHTIDTRLHLAASYARLERKQEARTQANEVLKLNPAFALDTYAKTVMHERAEDREHIIDGLRLAGLPEHPPLSLPDKPSIAVLPFNNLSGDPEQDYFVDGFTNAITTSLSRFPELFVIANNSAFTYKGRAVRVKDVGRDLGVRYVLEGSVQRGGDRLAVHAQLIEADTENHAWAQQYNVADGEIFAVQDSLVEQIVGTIAAQISMQERPEKSQQDPGTLGAYDLFLRGYKAFQKQTREGYYGSIQLLRSAIEIDPEFAEAHAMLSWAHLNLWRHGLADNPPEALRQARSHAHKSFEQNHRDYRSHWALGTLHLFADQDHELALAEYETAIALNPNQANLLAMMSLLTSLMGRGEEAIDWVEKAMRLNPLHPPWYNWNASLAYYLTRGYDDALLNAKVTAAAYAKSVSAHRMLAAIYAEMGRMEDASAVARKILELDPDFSLSGVRNTPFQRTTDLDRYYAALRKAGLPE